MNLKFNKMYISTVILFSLAVMCIIQTLLASKIKQSLDDIQTYVKGTLLSVTVLLSTQTGVSQ